MSPRRRLGELLMEEGLIDELQLRSAMGHQKNWGGKLGSALVELGFIEEDSIARVLGEQLKQKCLPFSSMMPQPEALELMSMQEALKYVALPLQVENGVLIVAMSNPFDLALTDEMSFKLGKRIKGVLAVESAIKKAIKKFYGGEDGGRDYRIDMKLRDDAAPEIIHYGGREDSYVRQPVSQADAPTGQSYRADGPAVKRVEPSGDLISKALAYLLIEKGIINKEDLIEKMRQIKEKEQA
ncbi:MAG TPA: hypothetical protein VGK71_07990 [Nitrospirota bacterium]